MEPITTPLQDQLANISPVYVIAIVAAFTMLRLALSRVKDNWARTVSETCDTVNFVLILAFLLINPLIAKAFYIPSPSMENTLLVKDRLMVNKFTFRFGEPQRGDVLVFDAPPRATGGKQQDFIKRLIAIPGDRLKVTAAALTIGGQEIPFRMEADNLHQYLRNRLGLKETDALKIFPDYLMVNGTQRIPKERIAEALGQPGRAVVLTPGRVWLNDKPQEEAYIREDPDYDYAEIKIEPGQLFMMGDNRNQSADSHYWGTLERNRVIGKAWFIYWPFNRAGIIR